MDFLYVALLDCAPAANFSAASASRRAEALSRTEEEEDAKGRETSSAKARSARDLIVVAASPRDCCYLPPPTASLFIPSHAHRCPFGSRAKAISENGEKSPVCT